MNDVRWKRFLVLWPFWALGTLTVVFLLMLVFSRKAPVITSLEPPMAAPGQQVVVTGDYFGRTEREGSLTLAGEIPPPSLILSWSDQKIVFVVPEDASSGLVTVSNSQGTCQGILFTNTESIPTVLRPAALPGVPLLLAAYPSHPIPGQVVTLTGRGFGAGDDLSFVRVAVGPHGPFLEVGPSDSSSWSDRSVTFRWPAGAGAGTGVQLVTPRGESPSLPVGAPGPLSLGPKKTIDVDFRAEFSVSDGKSVVLTGPVPQRSSGTAWVLVSSDPAPVPGQLPLVFRFGHGISGDRTVSYRLTLTTSSKIWAGPPSGVVTSGADLPSGDPRPKDWWAPSAGVLKNLTAKWGLDTPDPWLRVQRIQTGLTVGFQFTPTAGQVPTQGRKLSDALVSGRLDSYEASSLAAYLAGLSGIPVRLVSGLWQPREGTVTPRVWTEFWLAGAGWVPWDVIDGSPGTLDNQHFAFETTLAPSTTWLPRSKPFGVPAPGDLGNPSGESAGPGEEPVVRWEITQVMK